MFLFFKKYASFFVIFGVLATHLTLGLLRLKPYSAVDEPYWTYGRTPKFWNAVILGKWRSTNINDKPGITTAILSGAGLLSINPLPYSGLRDDAKTDEQLNAINDVNFFFRLPIFLFCFLSLPLFFLLLKKLFDETTALVAFVFIGLSPILLGISLIINPDSLLWIFLPLSLLSFLVFQRHTERKYLYLSGVFLGLSLLTKYVANILYVFFFALPFLEYVCSSDKPDTRSFLKRSAQHYLILTAISLATFFVLFPATWEHPKLLLEGTFLSKAFKSTWPLFVGFIAFIAADAIFLKERITSLLLGFLSKYKSILVRVTVTAFLGLILFGAFNALSGMSMFTTDVSLASPKGSGGTGSTLFIVADNLVADIYSLIFGISPIALFALTFALIIGVTKKRIHSHETKTVFFLSLFILFYYIASTVNHVVATVRYQIALYPLAFIIAAVGISNVLSIDRLRRYCSSVCMISLLFFVSLVSLLNVKPFYFAYTSAFLPKPYFLNFKDMGDGSWEVADFLNHLPNPRELTIWSDKGAVCAAFVGDCRTGLSQKDLRDLHPDYVVVSSGRRSRTLKLSHPGSDPLDFKKAYQTDTTAFTVTIGGRSDNFVKVVSGDILMLPASSSVE